MGISQIYEVFYEPSASTGLPQVGDIYWVPTPEVDFKIIEAQRATPHAHQVVDVVLRQFDAARHYREKDHLPVKLIQIDEHSEALLFKSKLRPCVVLGHGCVDDLHTLKGDEPRRAKQLGRRCYIVAPMYSATTPMKPTSFTPVLTARIKALHYAHFAWLPPLTPDTTSAGSVLRLDRMFSSELGVGVKCAQKRLAPDILDLVQTQMCQVLGIEPEERLTEALKTAQELVAECLPPGLA